jgi:CubicO group peptidase (beta-lactamase class C family)
VRRLARNVSGLEVAPYLPVSLFYGNTHRHVTYGGDLVRAAMNYPAVHPPSTRFEVTQEPTQLLAHVIEGATGFPMQTLLPERVWKPSGTPFQFDRPNGHARAILHARDAARFGLRPAVPGAARQVGGPAGAARRLGEDDGDVLGAQPELRPGRHLESSYRRKPAIRATQKATQRQNDRTARDWQGS